MADRQDGGPAFPHREITQRHDGGVFRIDAEPGMSLRDYFAAFAMCGLVASNDDGAGDRITEIPGYAYDIADAMLKAREGHS